MHKQYPILLDFNLHLFDGAAGADAGDGAAAGEASALPKAETIKMPGSSRRAKAGAYDNVVFGKQEDAPETETTTPAAEGIAEGNGNKSGVTTTSDTLEAKRQAFRDLTKGEYKDQFTEEVQRIINNRFKETKGMEESLSAQKPIMDMLMQKYKIGDGDMSKLQKALEQDNSYWEGAAEEAGLTVEQYKAYQKLERENAEFKRMQQNQKSQEQARQQVQTWMQEADRVKQTYSSFNLEQELANKEFLGLLKAHVPMQHAYELMHMDEIKAAAAKSAAETASQQMTANIKAKASRPAENGTSRQSAVITKSDVDNLTKADRAEIARRVQRGEIIKF